MENYMKYLNKYQQTQIKNYTPINDKFTENLKPGDLIKYIEKKNLKFRQGGKIEKVYNDTILVIKGYSYNHKKHITFLVDSSLHIIFYKKTYTKQRDLMEYILKGLNDNSLKITKKNCD